MLSSTSPQTAKIPRRFYRTAPRRCPYLADRVERDIFTDLTGPESAQVYDALSQAGFRRSHHIVYRPLCPSCRACVPVRVVVREFAPSRSLRRVLNANADLAVRELAARATAEQYRLFARYQRSRHNGGGMSAMSFADYQAMVEDSPVDTFITEFRSPLGELVATSLNDRLPDSLSAVYSCFDPAVTKRSLGTFTVLQLIRQAQAEGLSFVYLGYWIQASPKMAYKVRFRPLQALGGDGWRLLEV